MLDQCGRTRLLVVPFLRRLFSPLMPSSCHIGIRGMPTKQAKCVHQLFLLATTCVLIIPTPAAAGLCGDRCEKANPYLNRLKAIWSRAYSRETVDFNEFIQYLISAAGDSQRLSPLRATLLRTVGRYRDCVMACEHAFSKRSSPDLSVSSRKNNLCDLLIKGMKVSSTPIPKEILSYCFTNVP